ncbi:hypothetical protein NGK27_00470 [Klebsiella quasipneumoniae]|uniref:hypothetical protein n=1 Tax=Klebsiella quasipneumoniae TaxID=1463165 RepID=UPI002DBAC675|nr:hypothetical protein [Klebsiella quasipneumoniae]MEB7825769.1 hypothetical protein [Klebsiella quasipneumoniae]
MTKSTITRDRLQEIAEDGFLKHGESKALARIALAAMDSEPDRNPVLAYADSYRDMSKQGIESVPIWSVITDLERNIAPLYRHAQPVPVVLDAVDTNLIEALRLVQCMLDDYRERNYGDAQGWIRHINTHMSDYTEAHGDDAYSVLHNLITAAPQSPGSEPATVPGKWIPVSEQKPDCWCLTCRPVVLNDMRFVVCPDCGNKRCPRANDHRNACTGSNEPGQQDSAYPDTPQEVKP